MPTGKALLTNNGAIEPLDGDTFPEIPKTDYEILCGARPAVRKLSQGIICSAKIDETKYLAHYYNPIPKGVGAPDLVKDTIAAAQNFVTPEASEDPVDYEQEGFLKALTLAQPLLLKHRLSGFAGLLSDQGYSDVVVVIDIRRGKIKRLHYSNMRLENARSELRFMITKYLRMGNAPQGHIDDLDADLLAENLGGRKLCLLFPETDHGIGLLSIDTSPKDLELAANNLNALKFLKPYSRYKTQPYRWFYSFLTFASIVALIVYLALPAPFYVNATVETKGAKTRSISLPFPTSLNTTHVLPGDFVETGQLLVTLRSDEIKQFVEQERLEASLEALNAQEALEQQNYNQFQISQARQEISEARLKQLLGQLNKLSVKAPEAGRISFVLAQSDRGNSINTGAEIARLQLTDEYDVLVKVPSGDAYLLEAGQFGEVTFKGVTHHAFKIETQTPPTQNVDPETNQVNLEVRARILDDHQNLLLPGLVGFAKIEVGTSTRAFGLTRQALNFIRYQIWKTLGLNI